MSRETTLGLPRSFEATPLTRSVSRWLRRDFSAIVQPLVLAVFNAGQEITLRGPRATQPVAHHLTGNRLLPFKSLAKEALGGALVPPLRDENVEDGAVLIDRTPEIVARAATRHYQFIYVPRIAQASLAMPQSSRKRVAELQTPLADRLVADSHSALG